MSSRPQPVKVLAAALLLVLVCAPALYSQHPPALHPEASSPRRIHLVLKDGGYQIVMSYKVVGNIVHYISAERGGAEEEIPLSLVDLEATKRWGKQHAQPGPADPNNPHPPATNPHLPQQKP